MGYHMSLFGFKEIPEISKPKEFKVGKDVFANRIMYGEDCDMSPCRSPFHDAMFTTRDICFLQGYEGNVRSKYADVRFIGCFSNKDVALSNFIKWSKSKVNPFSHLLYFDDAVKAFIEAVTTKASDYKYLFWDSSTLYNHMDTLDDKRVERFLKQSCMFYDVVRSGKKASSKVAEFGVKLTYFVVKKSKIEFIDWLPLEEIKERAEKYGMYPFYGDI